MRLSKVAISLAIVLVLGGCTEQPAAPVVKTPPVNPNPTWAESLYSYDDTRCSNAEEHAIHAAVTALMGSNVTKESASDLRFAVAIIPQGWEVDVWRVEPGKSAPTGVRRDVRLDHDYKVTRVGGGA